MVTLVSLGLMTSIGGDIKFIISVNVNVSLFSLAVSHLQFCHEKDPQRN